MTPDELTKITSQALADQAARVEERYATLFEQWTGAMFTREAGASAKRGATCVEFSTIDCPDGPSGPRRAAFVERVAEHFRQRGFVVTADVRGVVVGWGEPRQRAKRF